MVNYLDIGPIFPLDETIRVMNESSAQIGNRGVFFKGRLSVTVGERLLNLQMLNIQWIVSRVIGVAVAITFGAKEKIRILGDEDNEDVTS